MFRFLFMTTCAISISVTAGTALGMDALIVGDNAYHPLDSLNNARNDAVLMSDLLSRYGIQMIGAEDGRR